MATPATRPQAAPTAVASSGLEWRSGGGRASARGGARTVSHPGRSRQGEKRSPQRNNKEDAEHTVPTQKKFGNSALLALPAPPSKQRPTPTDKAPAKSPNRQSSAAADKAPAPPKEASIDKAAAPPAATKAARGRRGSRLSAAVPTLVIDPSSPVTPNPTSSAQPAPPMTAPLPATRTTSQRGRRRPRNHNRTASSRSSVSVQDDPIQVPTSAAPSSSLKQPPPHLVAAPASAAPDIPSFSHKVDNLVDRMRAMATSRASSPGSHHDWAEDDEDDTLPDLDDWGYTTKSAISVDEKIPDHLPEAISPILQNDLRPLPDPAELIGEQVLSPVTEDVRDERNADLPANDANLTTTPVAVSATAPTPVTFSAAASKEHPQVELERIQPSQTESMTPKAKHPAVSRKPSHPNLPSKPLEVVTATPDLSALPSKADVPHDEPKGLSASMHAPITQPVSAPSHISSYANVPPRSHPSTPRGKPYQSGRNATPGHRGPYSPPATSSRPTSAYQPRHNGMHHIRARSSPVNSSTGIGNGRHPLHNRPVITVDAISKLVRTLGGKGDTSPASKPTPVAND
ncbi:hypothetical protein PUNSTDRAFT_119533 [Punctularia strigosozonata HHB-11173 SS5]|uniref:uncharacterized protein n=1 Tax=Punctularia strigosozonata (strain HHB-11173) TaxID=741275 RepID=UPI0004417331|nr:uncharacterized protein PUNSTDRAFT_119533 [Punctularia strigosozonata HHB-11173 SS5]EIN10608.1 hypothetical protein PUNSTDRAFT_119533 [Punctularia strigosozonata HHB-11173 SS5]